MTSMFQRSCGAACASLLLSIALGATGYAVRAEQTANKTTPTYTMQPIGWVRKSDGRTFIEIDPRYQPALLGVDRLKSLQVLWWFDKNDTPERRAVLQVHPRGNPGNPLRGVFATRSPYRPNLIALTEVDVIAVRGNVIEIDGIDAFADTPVLDLKP